MTNQSEKAKANLRRWHAETPRPILDLTANRCGLTLRCKCTVDTLQLDLDIVGLGLGTNRELGTLSLSTRDGVLEGDVSNEPSTDCEWVVIRGANGSACSFLEDKG